MEDRIKILKVQEMKPEENRGKVRRLYLHKKG